MIMPSGVRKAMLTAHVISSIGWFGAVAAFLALALTGVMSQDPEVVRAVYLVLGVTTSWVIVPLALLGLVTGIVSSLFTKWGLFRYYWVLIKLVITGVATYGLLDLARAVDRLTGIAAPTAPGPVPGREGRGAAGIVGPRVFMVGGWVQGVVRPDVRNG